MALKLKNSKVFPDKQLLINLGTSQQFKIRDAAQIIEQTACSILDFFKHSQEASLIKGLKGSIEQSVDRVRRGSFSSKPYRHDKKKKFE